MNWRRLRKSRTLSHRIVAAVVQQVIQCQCCRLQHCHRCHHTSVSQRFCQFRALSSASRSQSRSQWWAIGQTPTYTHIHTLSHSDDKCSVAVRIWTRRASGGTTCLNWNPLVDQERKWIIPLGLTSARVIGCVPIQTLHAWKYAIWIHWGHSTALSLSQFTKHQSVRKMRPSNANSFSS